MLTDKRSDNGKVEALSFNLSKESNIGAFLSKVIKISATYGHDVGEIMDNIDRQSLTGSAPKK